MESATTKIDSKIRRLHRLIGKKVVIATKHVHSYEGKLVAFDHHTNLQLSRGVMFRRIWKAPKVPASDPKSDNEEGALPEDSTPKKDDYESVNVRLAVLRGEWVITIFEKEEAPFKTPKTPAPRPLRQ